MRTKNTVCPFCGYPDFSLVEYSKPISKDDPSLFANVVCLGCNKAYDLAMYPYCTRPSAYEGQPGGERNHVPTRSPSMAPVKPRLYLVK